MGSLNMERFAVNFQRRKVPVSDAAEHVQPEETKAAVDGERDPSAFSVLSAVANVFIRPGLFGRLLTYVKDPVEADVFDRVSSGIENFFNSAAHAVDRFFTPSHNSVV